MILWGVTTTRTLRAHWALAELDLPYERRPIRPRTGETKTDEFTRLTARQKVPVLQDGDLVLTESAAIVAYLSDRYGNEKNRLYPPDPTERAVCLEWNFFIISELDAASLYVIRRHESLKDIYGHAPVANEAAAEYFVAQMRSVDRALGDGRRFIVGDRFSSADILLSTCLSWAIDYGVPVSPAADDYNARVKARPAYARAVERNRAPADCLS
ncbi:MAG TPA: glutathione S-transferase family protein [Acetobacteraceae bacterium]|nr:glutathione S-transferase family protein [Acetobacteraceae bacterium]